MPEALKCPSCAAPLDYPPGGGDTMRCPYCNTTVMISGASSARDQNIDLSGLSPLIGKAMQMSQVAELLRQGKKIQAIQIIRQTHGVDLASAKAAVDHLSAAVPGFAGGNSTTIISTSGANTKLGAAIVFSVFIFIGIIFFSVFLSVHHQTVANFSPPQVVLPAVPMVPDFPGTPAPSKFAHMTLEFGSEGIGAGQFKDSRSIAVDGAGHVYVGEFSDGRVQVFDPQGKFLAEWSLGRGKSLMNLTADQHGNVYAVVPFQIIKYDGMTGMPQGQLESMYGDTQENYWDACAALNGDVFGLTNDGNVVDIGADGKIKSIFNCAEKSGEDLGAPDKIAVLPTGEIYILDRQQGVFKFGPDGRYINRFASVDNMGTAGPGHLFGPNNIAVDGKGRIYVSDSQRNINVFDSDGTYVDAFGENDVVFGIAVDNQNQIWACYRNKHTIQKFELAKP
jgi:LSD1 subclass zinc finger protein